MAFSVSMSDLTQPGHKLILNFSNMNNINLCENIYDGNSVLQFGGIFVIFSLLSDFPLSENLQSMSELQNDWYKDEKHIDHPKNLWMDGKI